MAADSAAGSAAIGLTDLRFAYEAGADVLDISHFEVQRSEGVFLQGASGSGKSTLLSIIAGVLVPDSGNVAVLGRNLGSERGSARDRLRSDHIGFIFQQFNLLPYLSVVDNVTLPCGYSPRRKQRACEVDGSVEYSAQRLLADLGINEKLQARASSDLSVGQQQRVAAARALIGRPEIVIADEPTSALDTDRRQEFVELLISECRQTDSSIVFVSHDTTLATYFDRAVELSDINEAAAVDSDE